MPNVDRSAIIIAYHFLRARSSGRFQLRAHETPERFRAQVAQVAKRFPVCSTRALVDPDSGLTGPQVAIHFDDGAGDVARNALPILRDAGVTATVFICARPYVDGRLLGVQKIEYLVHRLGLGNFRKAFYAEIERRCPGGLERESLDFAGGYRFYRYDDEPVREFKLDLNYQTPYAVVEPVLDVIFEETFGPGSEAEAVAQTYLSRDDLARLIDAGIELGVHTHNHRVLPRLDYDAQQREISVGLEFVKEVSGDSRPCVAYPFGFSDERTIRATEAAGARAGFGIDRRAVTPGDIAARWCLPRYDVNDCFDRASNELVEEVFAALPARADPASTT
jgi:peptidoglycan/xylan/chitin deacetylase (PgdA/CDA1 family)